MRGRQTPKTVLGSAPLFQWLERHLELRPCWVGRHGQGGGAEATRARNWVEAWMWRIRRCCARSRGQCLTHTTSYRRLRRLLSTVRSILLFLQRASKLGRPQEGRAPQSRSFVLESHARSLPHAVESPSLFTQRVTQKKEHWLF